MASPIAQTFTVDTGSAVRNPGAGCFATKIDLFFATKHATLPIIVQLREVDSNSGLVTNNVLPFSTVIVSASAVNTSDDASKPTPFVFPSPVFLQNKRVYAFIVKPSGNNPDYRLFSAKLGEADITTGNRITQQPATGDLYISSNDTIYQPVLDEDIKFTLYVGDFNKDYVGYLTFKNEPRDYLTVANVTSGFDTVGETIYGESLISGTFANTKSVNVNSTYAQGMLSGATGTITSFSSSLVRVRGSANSNPFRGGERIRIRNTNSTTGVIVGNSTGGVSSVTTPTAKLAFYDPITASNTYLHLANVSFMNSGPAHTLNRIFQANTYVKSQSFGRSAKIVITNNLPYEVLNFNVDHLKPANTHVVATGKFATAIGTRDSSYLSVNLNDDTQMDAPRYILSRSLESNTSATSATMATRRSFEVTLALMSTSRLLSPAIDLQRSSATVIHNLINSNTAIQSTEDYTKAGGSAEARYITRTITLAEGQDAEDMRVYLSAYKPSDADVFVYYKILHREDSDSFIDARWIPMTQNTAASVYSDDVNTEDFKEFVYEMPPYTNAYMSGANTNNSSIVEYRNSARARFVGYKAFAIKVVLVKETTSNPPRIRDLRVIALQR